MKKQEFSKITKPIIVLLSFFVAINLANQTKEHGYELIFLQPLTFIFFLLMVYRGRVTREAPPFFMVILSIAFLRYVILPFITVESSHYHGRSLVNPLPDSYNDAIILTCYEAIVVGLFIMFMENRRKPSAQYYQTESKSIFTKNFILFIGSLSALVTIAFPSSLALINIVIPINQELIDFDSLSILDKISTYLLITSKQIIFLFLIFRLSKKYKITNNTIYINLAKILVLINTIIYFGVSRIDILVTGIASIIIYYKLFPRSSKAFIGVSIAFALILVSIVSSVRGHATATESWLTELADIIQVYTGGIYNVAIGLETKDWFPDASNISTLMMDIFRPVMGINILLKNVDINYSNIYFNQRLQINTDLVSQIIPAIAQGNLYFGYLLAPIFIIPFIYLYYIFEKITNQYKKIELNYFLSILMIRLGFIFGQNSMNMLNEISMNLTLLMIFILINNCTKIIKLRN